MKTRVWILLCGALHVFCQIGTAQENELNDLLLSFGDEDFISIATGQKKAIAKAPAVASVITADDIKSTGARTVEEALESVPGLHVSVNANGYLPIYTFRGIYSQYNPQVLFLINGIPITNVFIGDRNQVWGRMPVEAVERIEIIRGPGSAVYGADAFAGVINVITKSKQAHNEAGIRVGSFSSRDAWVSARGTLGDWDASFTLETGKTDGHEEIIDSDLQTVFDLPAPIGFGTNASLAPGPAQVAYKYNDLRMELSKDYWTARFGYQGRSNIGTGAGIAQVLDSVGGGVSDRYNADFTYKNTEISPNWELSAQVSWFDTSQEADLRLFPPGTVLPIGVDGNIATAPPISGFVLFPEGVFGNPYVFETHLRTDIDSFYKGFDKHTLRVGAGWSKVELKAEERKNFGPGVIDGTEGIVDGTLTDVTGTSFIFMQNEDRDVSYVFVQDEWELATDWELTAGVRYDDYSDFGDTVNPRLALVWQAAYNMTAKLLYGQAFRAPSFQEQFNINNPIANGNPNLQPEEIDTIEVAFDYTSASGKVHTTFNAYIYEMTDIIRFVPDPAPASSSTAQNFGEQDGIGLEWEMKWDVLNTVSLHANYAWQNAEDPLTNADVANAPQQQLYIRCDWNPSNRILFNTQVNHIANRKRELGSIREEIDDYTTVDLTARFNPEYAGWVFAASIRNAFDEDVREPSPAPGYIANDLPMAGRSTYVEARYSWK